MDIPLPYNVQLLAATFFNVGNFLRKLVFAEDSAFFYASMTNKCGSHIEAIPAARFLVFWCLAASYCTDILN
jgi:hypothetical protein